MSDQAVNSAPSSLRAFLTFVVKNLYEYHLHRDAESATKDHFDRDERLTATGQGETEFAMKRVELLNIFADHLGWPELSACRHVFQPEDQSGFKDVVWYESEIGTDCRLQINERPLFAAGVYAMRHGLFAGFHRVSPLRSARGMRSEADRLDQFLNARWFITSAGREAFAHAHPECTGWNDERLSSGAMPYEPS